MNYQRIYDQIIDRAKEEKRVKVKGGIYYEAHHTVPQCMGGEGKVGQWKTHPNIVLLTAREHFLCHWLLCRIYPKNKKLTYAFWAMCNQRNARLKRHTPSSRAYQEGRELFKDCTTGQTLEQKVGEERAAELKKTSSTKRKGISLEDKVGKERADQIKKQMSDSRKGNIPWNRGITPKPESIEKGRVKLVGRKGTFKGKTHKESSKELMRKAKEGKYVGKDSPTYGTGRQIIELSTGFVGYMYDQQKQFNIPGNTSIYKNIKKGKPFVIGKNKGLQFSFLEDQK